MVRKPPAAFERRMTQAAYEYDADPAVTGGRPRATCQIGSAYQ
jgi:hypothetical protein